MMQSVLLAISGVLVGALAYRYWLFRHSSLAVAARQAETERIVAALSSKQPGVWDADDLRERVLSIARDLWSAPTRADIDRVQMWVHPELLTRVINEWPTRGVRRDVVVQFKEPPHFVHVMEGGPGADSLTARVVASIEAVYFDSRAKQIKRVRKGPRATYHRWVHIDGQGWRLDGITHHLPVDEPSPHSVSYRVLASPDAEEIEQP
jgi:hypothetical protein